MPASRSVTVHAGQHDRAKHRVYLAVSRGYASPTPKRQSSTHATRRSLQAIEVDYLQAFTTSHHAHQVSGRRRVAPVTANRAWIRLSNLTRYYKIVCADPLALEIGRRTAGRLGNKQYKSLDIMHKRLSKLMLAWRNRKNDVKPCRHATGNYQRSGPEKAIHFKMAAAIPSPGQYSVYIHRGDARRGNVAARYVESIAPPPNSVR